MGFQTRIGSPAEMVQDGRVHRAAYSDPGIFELEMQLIFGRSWLYVGHESQVPTPGSFFSTFMGRQPVVMTRHTDGNVYVVFNRCTHRGAKLCTDETGKAKRLVCCYHGWSFEMDGTLAEVPLPDGYPADYIRRTPDLNLTRVPRVDSYRGFVFASLAPEGPDLVEWLGYMKTSLDDMVDRSPSGELVVAGGTFKHAYAGNWKLVIENHNDTLHPRFVHASSTAAARDQSDAVASNGAGEIAIRQMRQNGAPAQVWEDLGIWTSHWGHSFMGDYHSDHKLMAQAKEDPVQARYIAALEDRVGAERAAQILSVSRFNTIVYPNLSFMSRFRQLRVVHPVAVDRTVVYTYCFRMPGAPDEMFRDTVAFANVVNGTGSLVLTDDLETYERVQVGLASQAGDWVDLARGLGGDRTEENGTLRGSTGTSEINVRNQFQAWRRYMAGAGR
jgi:phenylpropionate dioxygenase-like ring-hydroxylating dioxygenase large terminal subunit